jgi:transposase-like protein
MRFTEQSVLRKRRHGLWITAFALLSEWPPLLNYQVGGKARNMHRADRARKIHGTGGMGKVAVMGLLERHGEVRTMVVQNVRRKSLRREIDTHVETGSMVYSDALKSYNDLNYDYIHNVINHAEKYVEGNVHTNGIENFWSLLKRSLGGTYISVEPYHLFRYLDEQSFRFNNRKMTDGERFSIAAIQIIDRRVTYKQLTGKFPTDGLLGFLNQIDSNVERGN